MAMRCVWIWACCLACAHSAGQNDASCMLQAPRNSEGKRRDRDRRPPSASAIQTEIASFCSRGTNTLDFLEFEHGEEVLERSIAKVKITGVRGKTGGRNPCQGPMMILDTNKDSPDDDLTTCKDCKMAVYSADGSTTSVNDCPERPGPIFTFDFNSPEDIQDVLLWDMDDGETNIILYDKDGGELQKQPVSGPPSQGVLTTLNQKNVAKLVIEMGGSGAIVNITGCKRPGGSVFGDPHIYTLDGEKFDLYENGTFSVFRISGLEALMPSNDQVATKTGSVDWQLYAHYGGPRWTAQGLLLVDRSMGRFRQALEVTTKDCQWRSKTTKRANWTNAQNGSVSLLEGGEYVTGFEYFNEKHVNLRVKTKNGFKDSLILNTVCKPAGINLRVSMPDLEDAKYVEGQIQLGNGKRQDKFAVKQLWSELGGSDYATSFLAGLQQQKYTLITSCTETEREKAEQICTKHLGNNMRNGPGTDAAFFSDCVFDVCRGGEDFAIAAAELVKAI